VEEGPLFLTRGPQKAFWKFFGIFKGVQLLYSPGGVFGNGLGPFPWSFKIFGFSGFWVLKYLNNNRRAIFKDIEEFPK